MISVVPLPKFSNGKANSLLDRPPWRWAPDGKDRGGVEVESGNDQIGHRQGMDALEQCSIDGIKVTGRRRKRVSSEMQVPHQPGPGPQGLHISLGLGLDGHRNGESFGPDPPSVAIVPDAGQRLQIGQHNIGQDPGVIRPGCQSVIPQSQTAGVLCGDARLIDGREPSWSLITVKECVDVSTERIHPSTVGKAVEMVREPKVQQVDDRLQTVLSAVGQGSIPKPPVIVAWFRLTQTPWCAISNNLHAERSNRAQIVINMGEMATLPELVLAIWHTIAQHQRIGSLFTHGPGKVGKLVFDNSCARHNAANLVDERDGWTFRCGPTGPPCGV